MKRLTIGITLFLAITLKTVAQEKVKRDFIVHQELIFQAQDEQQ